MGQLLHQEDQRDLSQPKHIKTTFSSPSCPRQTDGTKLSSLIYKYLETTSYLKPVRPTLVCDVTFKSTTGFSQLLSSYLN